MDRYNINMTSDVVQELVNSRATALHNLPHGEITKLIFRALDAIAPGSPHGLQGIDASDTGDGITAASWRQAIYALEMGTELVFPGWDGESQPVPGLSSFPVVKLLVAGRVAKSILLLNGYVNLSLDEITALHSKYHEDHDSRCR
jgi:hypothetical protein